MTAKTELGVAGEVNCASQARRGPFPRSAFVLRAGTRRGMAVCWEAEAVREGSVDQLRLRLTATQQDGEEGCVTPARRADAPSCGLGSS